MRQHAHRHPMPKAISAAMSHSSAFDQIVKWSGQSPRRLHCTLQKVSRQLGHFLKVRPTSNGCAAHSTSLATSVGSRRQASHAFGAASAAAFAAAAAAFASAAAVCAAAFAVGSSLTRALTRRGASCTSSSLVKVSVCFAEPSHLKWTMPAAVTFHSTTRPVTSIRAQSVGSSFRFAPLGAMPHTWALWTRKKADLRSRQRRGVVSLKRSGG